MDAPLDQTFISAKDAAALSGYHADYLARLCRSKKIHGRQVGRTWLVQRSSLETFIAGQEKRNSERARTLAQKREEEYREAQRPISVATYQPITLGLGSRLAGIVLALMVLSASAYAASLPAFAQVAQVASTALSDAASGFATLAEQERSALADHATSVPMPAAPRVATRNFSFANAGTRFLNSAPALVSIASQGVSAFALALGTSATGGTLALQSAAAELSPAESVALATYQSIHCFLFGCTQPALAVVPPAPAAQNAPRSATATSTPATTRLLAGNQTFNSYPTYTTTTVVQGVSKDLLVQSLANLRSDILNEVGAITAPITTQVATNETSIQQVNMIQSLGDLILHAPVIDNAQISDSSFTGQVVNADQGNFGILNAGTTTIAGPIDATGFTVNGVPLSGTGTVTSVDASGGTTGLTFAGGPVTTAGTLTLGGTLSLANGGTGTSTAPAYGQLLIGNALGGYDLVATSSLGIAGGGATYTSSYPIQLSGTNFSLAFGTTTANAWSQVQQFNGGASTTELSIGSLNGFLKATAGSVSTALVNLAADITGVLPIANGGTGTSTPPSANKLLLSDANGNFEYVATSSLGIVSATPTTWGSITGTLANQTDLQNALNAKQNSLVFSYPLQNLSNIVSLAFGTTTSNLWGGTQTFTNNPILGMLSGLIYGNNGTLATAATSTLSIGGNAGTATALQTARAINGVSFNGTADITINAASSTLLSDTNTFTAVQHLSGGASTTAISSTYASSTNAFFGNLSIANLSGVLHAIGGTISASAVDLAADITGVLGIAHGGTGTSTSPTYGKILIGDANGNYELTATSTLGLQPAGSYLTSAVQNLGPAGQLQSGSTITIASSTAAFNGLTLGLQTVGAGNSLTTTPTITGTLSNSGLTNSAITVNGTTLNLGDSKSITAASSTLLADSSTFTGTNTFTNPISGSVTGNAGTVTSGVYTTTFGSLFDTRLAATTTLPNITSLPSLGTVAASLTGFLKATAGVLSTSAINLAADVGASILPVLNGGTGWGNVVANSILLGNGTGALATTSAGTNGQVLALVNGVPTWQATSTLANISGNLAQSQGGTGQSSYTQGDILYADAGGTLQKLPVGGAGKVLTVVGNLPSWQTATGGGGSGSVVGAWATTTNNLAIYPTTPSWVTILGASATTTASSIFEVNGTSYFSDLVGIATTVPSTAAKLSVSGNGYFTGGLGIGLTNTNAGTLKTSSDANIGGNLNVTGATTLATSLSGILKTVSGLVSAATPGVDYENPLTFAYPLTRSINAISLAFGTTTSNLWGGTQTFTNSPIFSSLAANGLIGSNNGSLYNIATSTNFVTSIAGTANQIAASGSTGNVTLSIPSQFNIQNASSTNVSANTLAVGGTATTTIDAAGNLTVAGTASTSALIISRLATGLLHVSGVTGAITSSLVDLANDITGTLGITHGGTGLASLSGDQILYTNHAGTALLQTSTSTLSIGGNAGTATALQTPRNINNVSFNGTTDITITAASSTLLSDNNKFTGLNSFTNASTTLLTAPTAWITKLANLASAGFVKTGSDGTLSVDTNTYLTSSGAVTSLKQTYGATQTGPLTLATSSAASNNGVTVGLNLTDSSGFLFTPTVSVSNIPNAALANSSITVNGITFNLGDSKTVTAASSTLLSDANTFSGVDSFTNASSNFGGTWQTFSPAHFQTALAFTYPLVNSANTVSLAFGTTTANAWSAQNTFSSLFATNASSTNATTTALYITGITSKLLKTDSNGQVVPAVPGVGNDYLASAITALGPLGQTQTGASGVVTIATSSTPFNGLTASTTITGSGNTLTFANTLAGLLGVGGGGTGLASVASNALLYGSGGAALNTLAPSTNGFVLALSGGVPAWVATSSINNGVASLKQTYGSAFSGGLTLATSSAVTSNGVTVGQTITDNGSNTFTFNPTLSVANIPNAALANSFITVNGITFNLGDSKTVTAASSTLLSDFNNFANLQQFNGGASTTQFTSTGTTYLATAGGSVGIGTTSPLSALAVSGGASVGANYNIAAPANGLIVQGGVGIGTTTNPFSGTLSIKATGGTTFSTTTNANFNNAPLRVEANGTSAAVALSAFSPDANGGGNQAAIQGGLVSTGGTTGNAANLLIDPLGGTVGIGAYATGNGFGAPNTSNRLSVSGGTAIGNDYWTTAAPANGLLVEGNVGIGTSTPAAALDLEGQLRLKTYPLASLPAVGAYFGKVTRAANGLDGTPGILVSDESGQWYPITPIHRIAATSTLTVLGVGASPIGKLFNSNDGSNGGQVQFDTTLNASFPGANVVFLNAGSSGAGETPYGNPTTYFFDPITGADGPSYAKMIRVASTSSTVDAVIWGGAGDLLALASSTESRNEYKDHLRTLLTRIHTQYNAPIFLLYPNSGTSTPGISSFMGVTDSAMQIAREVEKELSTEMGFVYSGAESYDLAVSTDGYHVGDPGLVTEGQRLARSIANYYGANLTGTQGPKIVSAVHTDATHITVTVQHDAGTDFTVPPGGQFDGFKLLDGTNGFITVTSAARSTATTLTLTLASPPASGNETLYYAYGLSVPNPSLGGYDFVEDNASSVTGGLDPTMPLQSAVVQVSGSLATTVDDHHLDTDTGGNTIFRNLTTELARLTSTGLFGLGTTSPYAELAIAGYSNSTKPLFAISTSTASATTTALAVDKNGNLSLLNGASASIGGSLTVTGTTSLATALAVSSGGTGTTTLASNAVLYGNGAGSIQALAVNSSPTNKFLTQSSSGAPAWNTLTIGDITASGISTTNIPEGSNPYYSDLRVQSYLDTLAKGYFFSTTSATFFADASTTIPKTYAANIFTAANVFTGNTTLAAATSTTLGITGLANTLLYANGSGSILATSTNSVTCTGSVTCSPFMALSSSPITITSSGGSTQWTGTAGSPITYTANNVGVGTTTPWAALSVSTTTQQLGTFPLFDVGSTTGADLFNVLGNGNVGVGTTSPPSLLTISGGTPTSGYTDGGGTRDLVQSLSLENITGSAVASYANQFLETVYNGSASLGTVVNGLLNEVSDAASVASSPTLVASQNIAEHFGTGVSTTVNGGVFNAINASAGNGTWTDTATNVIGIDATARNFAGATSTALIGVRGTVNNNSGGAAASSTYSFRAQFSNNKSTALITNSYGFAYDSFINAGTIANTYGFYVNGIAPGTGTQINKPYDFYGADSGANNYLAGNLGIGTTSPFALLSVGGSAYIGGNLTATGTLAVFGNTTLADATSTSLGIIGLANTLLYANGSGSILATSSVSTNYLAGILSPANGGTGVNNGANAITLGESLNVTGGSPLTLTTSGVTGLTLPSGSNTAYTTANSSFSSSNLALSLSDETGSAGGGVAVFNASPSFTGTTNFTNASSSQLSVFQNATFGATATSSFSSSGVLTLAGIAGTQCLHSIAGVVSGTGSDCGAGGSSQWTGTAGSPITYTSNNVGVGTTTPWAALSVSTTTQQLGSVPLFAVASTTNATLFDVLGSGTVGIGTTTPSSLFTIVGTTPTVGYIDGTGSLDLSQNLSVLNIPTTAINSTYANQFLETTYNGNSTGDGTVGSIVETLDPATVTTSINNLFGVQGAAEHFGTGLAASVSGGVFNAINSSLGNGTWANTVSFLIGVDALARNVNSATTSTLIGVRGTANNNSVFASASSTYAFEAKTTNNKSSAIINNSYGFAYDSFVNAGIVNNAYGLYVGGPSFTNLTGTIGNTYGAYVNGIVVGTQTNTPFDFYGGDAGAHNYFAGNVGVGTSSPFALLSVGGNAYIGGNLTATGTIAVGTTTPWATLSVSTAAQQNAITPLFDVGSTTGADLFNVMSGGNVGIGTDAPAFPLHVVGNNSAATTTIQVSNTGGIANSAAQLFFGLSSTASNQNVGAAIAAVRTNAGASGDTDLLFQNTKATTLNTNLAIKASGLVGIGTVSPDAALQITQTVSGSGSNNLYGIHETNVFSPTSGTPQFVFGAYLAPTLTGYSGNSIFSYVGQNVQPILSSTVTGSITNVLGYEAGDLTNNSSLVGVPNYYQFHALTVTNGNSTTTGITNNRNFSAGGSTAAAGSGGTVNNYAYFGDVPTGSGAGTTNNYGLYLTQNGGSGGSGTTNNYSIYSNSTASSYFAGNLGVGTTSPTALLSVEGNLNIHSTSGNNIIGESSTGSFVPATDFLYIGTSTPTTGTTALVGERIVTLQQGTGNVQGLSAAPSYSGTANNATLNLASGGGVRNNYLATNAATGFNANLTPVVAQAIVSGSFASSSNAADFYAAPLSVTGSSASITNGYGLWVRNATSGTITNWAGIAVDSLTGATNNTELLIGTSTNPLGNYGLYQFDTKNNYFAGAVGIGTTTPGAPFALGGNAYLDSNIINIASTTASGSIINYNSLATSTVPNGQINAFSIATTSTSATPLFTIDTLNNRFGFGGATNMNANGNPFLVTINSSRTTVNPSLGFFGAGDNNSAATQAWNANYVGGIVPNNSGGGNTFNGGLTLQGISGSASTVGLGLFGYVRQSGIVTVPGVFVSGKKFNGASGSTSMTNTDMIFGIGTGDATGGDTPVVNDVFLANGALGIGTTTPQWMLNIATSSTGSLFHGGQFALTDTSALAQGSLAFADMGGSFYLSTTSPSTYATSSAPILAIASSTGALRFSAVQYANCSLFVTNATGDVTCTNSDQRVKQQITPLAPAAGLAQIDALNPVSFYWRDQTLGPNQQYGFIAQQVQQIFPNLIATSSPTQFTPGGTLSLNYQGLIAPAIVAIQQLSAGYSLANPGSGATSTIASAYAGTSAPAITVTASGKVGIGTAAPSTQLAVNGTISANEYDVPQGSTLTFAIGTTTMTAQIPSAVLSATSSVDLYKLATYDLASIQTVANQLTTLSMRMDSLESRIAKLENGAVTSGSGSFSSSTLLSALASVGAYVDQGIAQFGTVVADQFVAATDSAGTSSAGSGVVLAGNLTAEVDNPLVHANSKVFITFTGPVGDWYLSDKEEGKFRVTLASAASADTPFDYFIVETAGQIATSTPQSVAPPASPAPPTSDSSGGSAVATPDDSGTDASSTPPSDTSPADSGSDASSTPPADDGSVTPPADAPPADVPATDSGSDASSSTPGS